jgi:eukaryotic translation initiation factor 2C
MKVRGDGESHTVDVTVCEYYRKRRQIEVSWSASFPCLDVGKPKRPNYLPLEVVRSLSF